MNKKELEKLKSKLPHGSGAEIAVRANVTRARVSQFFKDGKCSFKTETKILQAANEILNELKEQREAVNATVASV